MNRRCFDLKEKHIEVSTTTDIIASCNACLVRNYESKYDDGIGKVDVLYEVRIDRVCLRLCKKCLLELVAESSKALLNQEGMK